MSDLISTPESSGMEPLLDTLLREAVPEIKLALGDLIDRENQRAIPDRYVKLLPEQTLIVTLRPDAGEAIQTIAAELERELSDSCMRHGSLYDRAYRVKLRVAPSPGAPLFRVSMRRGEEVEPEPFQVPKRQPEPTPTVVAAAPGVSVQAPSGPSTAAIAEAAENATIAAPQPPAPEPAPAPPPPAPEPEPKPAYAAPAFELVEPMGASMDPDATRLDGMPAPPSFDRGRFALAIEDEEGQERERFSIPAPTTTVGRQTDNLEMRADVAITDAPHVSRRQLALVWAPQGDTPGFTVYNLGLNPVHVGEREVAGANVGKGELRLDALPSQHSEWVAPGTEMVVGEHGPVLRIVDGKASEKAEDAPAPEPEVEIDPDATRFG
jgi:hypothetical protein